MRYSKLSEHTFRKGKFITPINTIPTSCELSDEKSWTYGRMPEYLWIGLILKKFGRDDGLRKLYSIVSELHKMAPELYTARMSQILRLDGVSQKKFFDFIISVGAKEALAPLTIFLTTTRAPVFAECFYCQNLSIEERCNSLIETMHDIMNHQSYESTDIRFVALYFCLLNNNPDLDWQNFISASRQAKHLINRYLSVHLNQRYSLDTVHVLFSLFILFCKRAFFVKKTFWNYVHPCSGLFNAFYRWMITSPKKTCKAGIQRN